MTRGARPATRFLRGCRQATDQRGEGHPAWRQFLADTGGNCHTSARLATYDPHASLLVRLDEFARLTTLANDRFAAYVRLLGGDAPPHKVEFSRRITTSWALIYYRHHLVRLSPYVFLLPAEELRHTSHWSELDATLRHEAAHAVQFARTRETGHSQGFHALLSRLGVDASGGCDLGPENAAFRYVYQCPTCDLLWRRRLPVRGNWSCGYCGPGAYAPQHRMALVEELGDPWQRVVARRDWVLAAIHEAEAQQDQLRPLVRVR